MLYFVQPEGGGPIKIGTTANLPTRIKQLEATYRKPLVVLATREGGRAEEREMHSRFSHLRFGRTEQFQPAPELLAFIGKPLFAAAGEIVEMSTTIKPVRLDLEGDVHRLLRLVAAENEMSMAGYAREMLETHLREEAKRLGIGEKK